MVAPAYQSKHVGAKLMAAITKYIEQNAPHHALVGLYTGENLSDFYKEFGFVPSFGMTRRI